MFNASSMWGSRLYLVAFLSACGTISFLFYTLSHPNLHDNLSRFSPFGRRPHSHHAADALEPLNTTAPRVLLVSAFFPLSKSKHTMSEYESWLSRFLQPITTDLYMYAPPALAPMIERLRGNLTMTLNTTFSSPFDIPPLQDRAADYAAMHEWDPEKAIHSPELYAVWTAKPYLLDDALSHAQAAGKEYEYAFWVDAGSFREVHTYKHWPDGRRVDAVFREAEATSGTPRDEIIFFPLWWVPDSESKWWREELGPIDEVFAEGSFFGGQPGAVRMYRTLYFAYHDHYLATPLFVGKDQTLINAVIYLFPAHFASVLLADWSAPAHRGVPDNAATPLGSCGSSWYYYQYWLARETEREVMADVWMEEEDERGRGKDLIRLRCRMAQTLTVEKLLQREFGQRWKPPRPSLSAGKDWW
ncbi:hypothetical protein EWM64_g9889 [Hericium alpestre]|uniref:Uncharacterized protein n=1 Tax=Hericium alpestre TaxID=135208 RepID=A0A4Y9ZJQ9_9AGAM|nr:hypothetical protein EWM64_g9889 [Hericium alpestre]